MRSSIQYREERTIYMIKPEYLLEDVIRALRKLGFEPSLSEEGGAKIVKARGPGKHVELLLRSEEKVIPGLEVLGEIPITHISLSAEGPEDFITSLRYRLEVELLRCLG